MALTEAGIAAIGSVAAALAGAGASMGGTAIANRNAYKWSKEFFDYQQQYNLEYYNPAANMERLRQAGINPHEVAGTPGSGMSMQGSINVPQYQSPLAGTAEIMQRAVGQAMGIYAQKKAIDNQTDLIQSQIAKNTADAAKTNYQVQNLLPVELDYQRNRSRLPLYQIGALKLQQQKMLNELSLFSMQKQKYQLALDLMQLEKQYQGQYYQWRNKSVMYDAKIKDAEAGIRGLDLRNYQDFGIRPQDPYYTRIAANVLEGLMHGDTSLGKFLKKWINFK